MATDYQSLGGRLALLRPDILTADQRPLYDQLQTKTIPWAEGAGFLAATPDGEVIGPFNALLRSPQLARALLNVERTESEHTVLPERVRQVIILTVGAVWQATYELYAHTAVARQAGLPEAAIQVLVAGQSPINLSAEESLAHEFARQLTTTHSIDDALYQRGIDTFGEQGLVDLIILAGQYMSVSALLNTFAVPAPSDTSTPPPPGSASESANPRVFWLDVPLRTSRRGHFWIAGERMNLNEKTYQCGPMYVAWEAPEQVTQPYPVVLVHGGTWQGTEWLLTPDGRPGWAQRLVESGYAVFIVDRPGHGRSPYHPAVIGPMGEPFAYEEGQNVYFPPTVANAHTQWPFDPQDAAALDAFIAPFGPLPADLALSQSMDANRLSRLLDRIGPAILFTHSASGPDGWLVADQRPGLVVAIVAIEPMSPPFAQTPGVGTLTWGITAAPITYNPPRATAEDAKQADPGSLQIPTLAGLPVALVTSETSITGANGPVMVDFLVTAGAAAQQLHLPNYGVMGNGHGLLFEKNSDQALAVILHWLSAHRNDTLRAPERSIRSI